MCGRFYLFFDDDGKQTRLYHKVSELSVAYAQKEIYPSQHALVLIEGNYEYNVSVMKWGISSYKGSLLINARSEGIHEKKTFIPMLSKRCLIPCNGFYEWKQNKKIYIYEKEEPIFYLAGIYNQDHEFVIVTGEADNQMKQVHHRTPIIIKDKDVDAYLHHDCEFAVDNENLGFRLEDSNEKLSKS